MTSRIVLAYFGDQQSAASIAGAADRGDAIAVALDLGDGIPLNELSDGALAAGAPRCHALDVREEFVRDAILPALRADTLTDAAPVVNALAASFVTEKLREMAEFEQATMIEPAGRNYALAPQARRPTAGDAAELDIRFADGVPFAVNEIQMSLIETMDCIHTISGIPAIEVLHLAYQQLDGAGEGQVVLRVQSGRCTVASTAVVF